MKKIFSLIAAVLFAGSMMAESITISAENFKSSYSESTFTISEVEYAYTGAMYNGKGTPTNAAAKQFIQLRKSGSGAGEIKNKGALNLKSIVVATQNNQAFTLSAGTAADALTEVTKPTGTAGKYTCEHKEGGTLEFDVTLYTFDVSGKKYFDFLNGDKAQYLAYITIELEGGDTPQEDVYTVAGEPTTVFGTTWDLTNTANDMAKQTDGSYKWEKTDLELGAGTVAFKVVKNRDWNNGANAWPAENYTLAIAEAGIYTITITFEPENENAVNATATKTGEAVVVPTVIMHGTFTGSWADTEAFAKAEDKKTASLKLTLAVGDIEFGLKLDGSWKANGATITRENASTSLASGSGNMHLTADVDGEYTFTYTYETQTLAVTFPALPISLTEFITNKPAEAVTLKDLTVIFATGKNTYVIDEDGVALVIYDANKTYYDGTLAAGKVLSGQKATYTSYKNQDEIIPANAANVSDGTAPEAELRTEAPTVADINKFIAFNNVAAEKASNNNYYIFDGAVQLYFASSSDKPSEDGNYDVEGVFINYNSTQLELIVTAIEKSKGTAIDNATVDSKAQKVIIDGQLFIIRDGVMFNANGAAVK